LVLTGQYNNVVSKKKEHYHTLKETQKMKTNSYVHHVIFIGIILLYIASTNHSNAQNNPITPVPKLITLDRSSPNSVQILNGPLETVTMRSGYMVLAPLQSVGKHSTKDNEEAIVVLAGTGEMKIIGDSVLHLRPYCVAYCPPNTEHDVVNIGTDTLRYIYIVAKAKK
jgi:mannose-6-phosphate isomerase-like protein (cupin superfamily)